MAKILYTDKKLICYVIGESQNIGGCILNFEVQYIQEAFAVFKTFNEKFKIKDPTLEGFADPRGVCSKD